MTLQSPLGPPLEVWSDLLGEIAFLLSFTIFEQLTDEEEADFVGIINNFFLCSILPSSLLDDISLIIAALTLLHQYEGLSCTQVSKLPFHEESVALLGQSPIA